MGGRRYYCFVPSSDGLRWVMVVGGSDGGGIVSDLVGLVVEGVPVWGGSRRGGMEGKDSVEFCKSSRIPNGASLLDARRLDGKSSCRMAGSAFSLVPCIEGHVATQWGRRSTNLFSLSLTTTASSTPWYPRKHCPSTAPGYHYRMMREKKVRKLSRHASVASHARRCIQFKSLPPQTCLSASPCLLYFHPTSASHRATSPSA